LLAGTALCLATGTAQAQAPRASIDLWYGFYVGGNAGYSWGHVDVTTTALPFTQQNPYFFQFPGGTNSSSLKLVGPIGGFQAGFVDWLRPGWLAGFEADFQWSGEKGSGSSAFSGVQTPPNCTFSICNFINTTDITAKLSFFGTVRGRGGPEFNGVWLYATAGVAYGKVSVAGVNTLNISAVGTAQTVLYSSAFSFSEWLIGYAVGVGAEGLISADGRLRWKLEYLHIDLGTIVGGSFAGTPFLDVRSNTHVTDDIIRVGLNYRFLP
jgi:outer membrane immunogenic protein